MLSVFQYDHKEKDNKQQTVSDLSSSICLSTVVGPGTVQSQGSTIKPSYVVARRPASPVVIITEPGATASQPGIIRLVARPMNSGIRTATGFGHNGTQLRLPTTCSAMEQLQRPVLRPVNQIPLNVCASRLLGSPSGRPNFQASYTNTMVDSSAIANAVRSPSILRSSGVVRSIRQSGLLGSSMSSPNLMSLGGGSHILFDNATGQIITNIRPPTASAGRMDELKLRKTFTSASGLAQVLLCVLHLLLPLHCF